MAFKYRNRNAEAWDKRANQTGGGEFDGFIRDDYKTWTPKKGPNAVRILPPTFDDADHYGINVFVHYSIGPSKAAVLCLQQMENKRCPICEARNRALKLGDEEEAKDLRATKRVLVWMLDRNDEARGPMLWSMAYTLDKDFCSLAKDPQSGEICPLDHPEDGHDIYFDKTGEGLQTQYGGKKLARRSSSVSEQFLDYIEERPLPECLINRTYDEVKELYEGGPAEEETTPRRNVTQLPARHSDGKETAAGRQTRSRAAEEDEEEIPTETVRRRLAATSEPTRTRREEINDEVPFDGGKHVDEALPKTQTVAERLSERYRRN